MYKLNIRVYSSMLHVAFSDFTHALARALLT